MEDTTSTIEEVEDEGTNLMNRDFISIHDKKVPSSMLKYKVGQHFDTREQLARTGIHPPFMSGIHPGGRDTPAQSIVMSGGYEDDVDRGDVVVYTGQGGQKAGSNVQIADQKMERGNLSLKLACDRGLPIHVTRGFKGHSPFAPSSGYRYDGLYIIERYWQETGKHGFKVWRYQMRRLEGQTALPEPKETVKTFKARQPRQSPMKAVSEKKRKRKSKRSKEEEEEEEKASSGSDNESSSPTVETESGQQQTCGYCGSYDFMTNATHKCIDHLEKHKATWIKQISQTVSKGGYQFETSDPLTDLTQRFYLNQMRVRAAIEEEENTCKDEGFMYQDELFLEQALQNLLWNMEEQQQESSEPTVTDGTPMNILQAYSAWNKDKETQVVN